MIKSALLVGLSAFLLVCAGACGNDSTTGRPVVLHTQTAADSELDGSFVTDTGWTVQLTQMALSVGSLYYFDGEPAFAMRRPPSLLQHVAALFKPSVAYAHPGHYVAGTATGQMTTPQVVELTSSPVKLSEGSGITGLYRSARFGFSAPIDGESSALAGSVAMVSGSASKDGKTVYFTLSTSLSDLMRSAKRGEVDGCLFEEEEVNRNGTVTVLVGPKTWLNLVDFVDLAEGTASAPTQVPTGHIAQIAFTVGVAQLSAYRFSYQADL